MCRKNAITVDTVTALSHVIEWSLDALPEPVETDLNVSRKQVMCR